MLASPNNTNFLANRPLASTRSSVVIAVYVKIELDGH
jgi:hypothetical protein